MKCIVTDTKGRRYELTASTLVELPTRGFVRGRLVLRAGLDNPEFRPAADMIYLGIIYLTSEEINHEKESSYS